MMIEAAAYIPKGGMSFVWGLTTHNIRFLRNMFRAIDPVGFSAHLSEYLLEVLLYRLHVHIIGVWLQLITSHDV